MLSDVVRVPHAQAMLARVAPGLDPVALGSVSDNVLDGYRAVAPHLAAEPGADVLIVCHGLKSVPLYGARPIRTDFDKPERRYRIVVDAGLTPNGLRYAIRATAPEATLQCVSFYAGGDVPMPLGRLYTLGIRFFSGRAHAAALLPQVMRLIEAGRLRPEEVTTRVVDWEEAPAAYVEPAIKLVVWRT